MASMPIRQYVSMLMTRGKTIREVYQAIKKHPTLKYTSNNNIAKAVNDVLAAKDAAAKFDQYKDTTKIDRSKPPLTGDSNPAYYSVHFTFTFGSGGKSNTRYMSLDVPSGSTKQEVMDLIKGMIRDWIAEHYEGRTARGIFQTIDITSIYGI